MSQFEEYAEKGLELKEAIFEWDCLEQALLINAGPAMRRQVELVHLLIMGNDNQIALAMLSIAAAKS